MKFLTPKFMRDWIADIRRDGFKQFFKTHGWKVIAAVVLFYLVRDTILYILIPYLIVKGAFSCG